MGYAGKIAEKSKARELRKKGYSVRQIEEKLSVSRSSVSLWCRDIILADDLVDKLYLNKKTGALKGSYVASQNKIKARKQAEKRFIERGKKTVGLLSNRDLFISGIALYAAEGEKTGGTMGLSNSDPRIIKLFLKWLRQFFEVPEEKLRASLYLHDNLDELAAKKYWSKITKVPLTQFCKTFVVKNKYNSFRHSKHVNGVLRVRVSDINLLRQILGYIDGLLVDN